MNRSTAAVLTAKGCCLGAARGETGIDERPYDRPVDEISLGLGQRDLRRNRWTIAGLTLLCAGAGAAMWWLPAGRGATVPDPDRVYFVTGVAVFWLFLVLYMVNQARGRTRLTCDHIRLESYVKRRSIPWTDVVGFEDRCRRNRGGNYWDVRVHRAHGRPLTMPGLFSCGERDRAFEANLVSLHDYWSTARALGGGSTPEPHAER